MAKALLDKPLYSRYLCSPRMASQPTSCKRSPLRQPRPAGTRQRSLLRFCCICIAAAGPFSSAKNSSPDEAAKLMLRVEAPESDVLAAVQQVTQDQIIHGTYSYEKERILYGAHSADSAHVFGVWKGPGKVFYKVAANVLSPRYFKDTEDIGTISVRYVVQSADANATTVQIDAIFVDARNVRHPSLGNVEASEYAAIQQHLRTIQSKTQEAARRLRRAPPLLRLRQLRRQARRQRRLPLREFERARDAETG